MASWSDSPPPYIACRDPETQWVQDQGRIASGLCVECDDQALPGDVLCADCRAEVEGEAQIEVEGLA